MKTKRVLKESINVRFPNGRSAVVLKHVDMIDAGDLNDGPSWIEGLASYTLNGKAVNRADDGSFTLVSTGERLSII